jgi:hypothetical protein
MTYRFTAVSLAMGALVAALTLGTVGVAAAAADEAKADDGHRNVDLEFGGGFVLGIEDDTTIDDTYMFAINATIELNDPLDFEFGAGYAPGESPDSSETNRKHDLWMFGGGFRWYFMGTRETGIRPYLMLGYNMINELKGEGTEPTGWYYGPGLRMMLGESSGLTLKVPLWTSHDGQSDTLLMPSLYYFYSF